MDPNGCCNPCCPPSQYICDSGNRPCGMHVQRLEPGHMDASICSPKVCVIFGGHDQYPPDDYCPPPAPKTKADLNTLGSPVGLVKSTLYIRQSDIKHADQVAVRFATYLKAFAKIYLMPEVEWNTAAIDQIISEGQTLYGDSKSMEGQEATEEERQIYGESEQKVKRTFDLGGCTFQIELDHKYRMSPALMEGDNGMEEAIPDLGIEFLRPTLQQFFRTNKYALVKCLNWYMLVWRARGVYFVIDFNGRKLNDFISERDRGVAMLICLKTLDNVLHLINNLSALNNGDPFSVREIKVVKLVGPDGKTMSREFSKRPNQFQIISPEYAYLKANLHLTLNRADPLRNRSALPVGITAMLVSKIDHPATWNEKVLDNIICYGVNICRCCWEQCLNAREPMDLDQFPTQLKIGQFVAGYSLTPRRYEGTWRCVPNFTQSDLETGIKKSFEAGDVHLLIQIEHQMYALWKKSNFIYLFDPYRHRVQGTEIKAENADLKTASLRMFSSVDTFLRVFNQILLETNRTSKFFIHRLVVNQLELAEKKEGVPHEAAIPADAEDEVKSLNENICFEEDETRCQEELGEISDYEDDDIGSVVELDIQEPKSETDDEEEGLEEEEGALDDLGEYESSSSGDGHGGRKRKRGRGGKGKGGGGGGKIKRKGDKDKGKKGKKGKGDKDKGGIGKKKDKKNKKDKDKKGKKEKKEKKEKDDKDKDKKDKKKKKKKKGKGDSESSSDGDGKQKSKKPKKPKKDKDGKEDEEDEDAKKKKDKKPKDPKETKDEKDKKDKKDEKDKKDKKDDKEEKDEKKPKETRDSKDSKDPAKKDDDRKKSDADKNKPKKPTEFGVEDMKSPGAIGGFDRTRIYEDGDDRDGQPVSYNPNKYPGYSAVAQDMAVVGSESGTYESICKLLRAGFKCANRILTMTPWGNYVVFRGADPINKVYFLFDGCTCNVNRFRHLDLDCGTAGLLCFANLHDVITYVIETQRGRDCMKRSRKRAVDEICRQYC